MSEPKTFEGRKESFVVVTSNDGEEYICLETALKKKSEATEEELKNCVSDSTTGGGASVGGQHESCFRLGEEYEFAVVGNPGRDYLWILSRTPTMGGDTYDGILGSLREQGFELDRLQKTHQPARAELPEKSE